MKVTLCNSFNPILPGPFEWISAAPPPSPVKLGFEVKVRKLIEDVISRQESHQAKEFTTLRSSGTTPTISYFFGSWAVMKQRKI